MVAQDERLKACSEALVNMRVLKLYAWETHFKDVIERLRTEEYTWLLAVQMRKAYNILLFWSSPVLVSAATFGAFYLLGISLNASNVFTFVATLSLVQVPISLIPDVIGVAIQAKVSLERIVKFLEAPELQNGNIRQKCKAEEFRNSVSIKSANLSWEENPSKLTLRNIYLVVKPGEKVAVCGEVGSEYVMGALSGKTVLLVTHQVDFLPAFDSVLLMSDGNILQVAPYYQLLASSREFQELVNAQKDTAGSERPAKVTSPQRVEIISGEIKKIYTEKQFKTVKKDQLIKQEEREIGDTGFKPYIQYLNQNKGFLYFTIAVLCCILFVAGQISQDSWMAANVQNPHVSQLLLIIVYLVIECVSTLTMLFRSLAAVALCMQSSKSIFSQLLNSLFHAPISFYDSTPLGRILSRVSFDLSIIDLDVPFSFISAFGPIITTCGSLGVLAVVTWQVLFVSIATKSILWIQNQPHSNCHNLKIPKYYLASAKEFMGINDTTKSLVANHLTESIAGAMTIRAFEDEKRFFAKNFDVIDRNASPFLHYFAANEWLIQRLELLCATILSSSALFMVLLLPRTYGSGFVGMALSYGLALNLSVIFSIQNQCTLANHIISVERLNQYMHIPSEAPEAIQENRPPPTWPGVGKVEILNLQVTYLYDLSMRGHKIGIVGRTGSGKTTLISALFRLVEPTDGKIIIDNLDISMIGLHDLRSHIGIIPQDPTLFNGTLRYNLDPLSQHSDNEIWEALRKCQLLEAVQGKEKGLDALVIEDGANWSMRQRQLFCLGRALLRRCRILVLDEATASIDNATDAILQKTIKTEFADSTVITVAHRIPTVMDCTKVLAMCDGEVVEFDEPTTLMKREGSLFGQLVKEYCSHFQSASQH
ncbi:hypothetical protein NE237_028181 [Protea cynaroides]|uniref:Uncharacterized protein n=1 Tax=Protea cynaroides TaxID=273540 RepID=A0A9Q0JSL8_9MAGN|nr:hypothetical protein NE237_028181 [Protea cynaroides]